jgi:putative flippase GtrA
MQKNLQKLTTIFLTKNFAIFFCIGLTTALFDYLLYVFLLSHAWPMLLAKSFASAVAVVFNYLLNSKLNFSQIHTMSLKYLGYYGILYVFLIIIHTLFNQGLFILSNNVNIAVFGALCISTFVNYLGVKKFFIHFRNQ